MLLSLLVLVNSMTRAREKERKKEIFSRRGLTKEKAKKEGKERRQEVYTRGTLSWFKTNAEILLHLFYIILDCQYILEK